MNCKCVIFLFYNQTWNDMLNVLRPPADMPPMLSLTARIKEMETSGAPKEGVDLENVTKCLKTYSIDQVRNINVGAAVMYEWVSNVCSLY